VLTGRKLQPGDIVKLRWLDACSYNEDVPNSWIKEKAEIGGLPSTAVGMLILSNAKCVIIAREWFHRSAGGYWCGAVCIPRKIIIELTLVEGRDARG
jgi:hypothetical protein